MARELRVVRWGLVPFWAKDPAIGSRLINARVETVDSKPSFRSAFAKRRCLLPADGFYEWLKVEQDGKARKQPYYIHRADGGELAFAGLYELWRDKSLPDDHPRAWLWTSVIITTTAPDEVGRIHDRMPMVIDPAHWADWLDPANNDASQVRPLLAPAAVSGLESYPVGTDVNYVRNNGPGLINPLAPDAGGNGQAGGGRGNTGPRSGPAAGRPGPGTGTGLLIPPRSRCSEIGCKTGAAHLSYLSCAALPRKEEAPWTLPPHESASRRCAASSTGPSWCCEGSIRDTRTRTRRRIRRTRGPRCRRRTGPRRFSRPPSRSDGW